LCASCLDRILLFFCGCYPIIG